MSKRFWTTAAPAAVDNAYAIALDGRPMRLPSGTVLTVANAALAQAIAAEWSRAGGAKGGDFTPADVPLTGLAGATLERIRPARAAAVHTLARYAEADALCYRVAHPTTLAAAQAEAWQPWLDWAARHHRAPLHVTTGITHIPQPAGSLAALTAALAARTDAELAALGLAIPLMGSCVLGLALAQGAVDAANAIHVSTVDERFQEQQWGADDEAIDRRARIAAEITLAAQFMALSRR